MNFSKTLFIIEVLTSFDAYPDNQLVAIRNSIWMYAFFITFVFLNILIFSTIPSNILANAMKFVRSKRIIIS